MAAWRPGARCPAANNVIAGHSAPRACRGGGWLRPWGAPRGCAQRIKAYVSRGAHPRGQTAAPAWPKGTQPGLGGALANALLASGGGVHVQDCMRVL